MADPCWLPSAIMQTTGAILGIYVGLYILAIGRFMESLEKLHEASTIPEVMKAGEKLDKSAEVAGSARGVFYGLIIASGLTIIANALWLDGLSANIFIPEHWPLNVLGFLGLMLFLVTVVYVCIFSIIVSKLLLASGYRSSQAQQKRKV